MHCIVYILIFNRKFAPNLKLQHYSLKINQNEKEFSISSSIGVFAYYFVY